MTQDNGYLLDLCVQALPPRLQSKKSLANARRLYGEMGSRVQGPEFVVCSYSFSFILLLVLLLLLVLPLLLLLRL